MTFGSMRVTFAAAALAGSSFTAAEAQAAVIKAGDYAAGSFFDTAAESLGPGRYIFSITLTTPVDFVDGYAEKQTVTNFFCSDPAVGPDEFNCGGNEVPTQPLWDQVTPTLYQAAMTVNPDVNAPFDAPPIVRYTERDECCTFQFGWEAPGAGSYVLSYRAVPEPATWALMLAGFGLTGAVSRRANGTRNHLRAT
jgi:hypothetical protein